MINNLLPCPFCGGEAADHDYGQEYWVKCKSCGALSSQATDRASADGLWNLRAVLAQEAGPVVERRNAELESKLHKLSDFARFVIKCVRRNGEYAPLSMQEPHEIETLLANHTESGASE